MCSLVLTWIRDLKGFLMKVDVTSDIHLDFWVDPTKPMGKQNKLIGELVTKLLPEFPSEVLVIAGDIGHYNWQNKILFEVLRKTYKQVLWVSGNHDLYMISHKIRDKFNGNSFERLADMVALSNQIDGVQYLDGTVIKIGDFVIGGGSGWYDGSYAIEKYGYGNADIRSLWNNAMNDANHIYDPRNKLYGQLNIFTHAEEETAKLRAIYDVCDLVVTHIAPEWSFVPPKYETTITAFYCFDGREMLANMKPNAHWLFGHTHDPYYYRNELGPTMVCKPLGYPNYTSNLSRRAFFTIELGKPIPGYDGVFK